jgi:hypothetical protein
MEAALFFSQCASDSERITSARGARLPTWAMDLPLEHLKTCRADRHSSQVHEQFLSFSVQAQCCT